MEAYEDLRGAIESAALVRKKDGVRIIHSEQSGISDPWIFDFRALMLRPRWINRYAEIFWEKYADKLPFQVGGLETAGIPLVAAIVMKSVERGTPINGFYIRKSRKRQGLMKYIEGTLTNEPVIFVDDLINSGQSANKQIDVLADAGIKVTDVFTLLAFRNDAVYAFFKDKGVVLSHMFTLPDFNIPLVTTPSAETPGDAYEVLWRYRGPDPSLNIVVQKSAPVLDEERVFFGCDDSKFRALSQSTGEVVWEFEIGKHPPGKAILSTPITYGENAYFGAYDGNVYALNRRTGNKVWVYSEADWIGSSPDIAPELGLIYIGLEFGLLKKQGGIAALDIMSGKEMWRAGHLGTTHGSPLYIKAENLVVIGSNDGILYAYDAKTGGLRWQFASDGEIKTRPAYDKMHREIVFGAMSGRLYALFAADGSPRHAQEIGVAMYSIPLVHDNAIYVASLDKRVIALDSATWKTLWTYETNGRIFASPVIHEGSLWIGSNSGILRELDPKGGALKSSFQASERIVNAVAFSGKTIFVPTVANEIYCLKKKD